MAQQKILIADDESRIRKLIRDYLEREGYAVLEVENGRKAVELLKWDKEIVLVILDIMMPEVDGYEVCRIIRESSRIPILMLTAKGEENDELRGFDCGADEYITKPFSNRILVARVNALLRRLNEAEEAVLQAGGILIDRSTRVATVDGALMDLSYKEFELMSYFLENQGLALSREKILSNVWKYDHACDTRTIDTHVKKLRSKMGAKGDMIKTIWGMGYKFEVGK